MDEDTVVEASSGSFRSRASTRDRLRIQLFSEKFLESKMSHSYTNEERTEDNKRRSWIEGSSNRLSLPPREPTASPGLSSPGGSKVSLSLDTEIDLPKAISIIQELKKTASPEDLVLLHKALLPAKDEYSPVSANSDESPASLTTQPMDRTIRRRSIQQAPGVGMRPSPRPSPLASPAEEGALSLASEQPSQAHQEVRTFSLPVRSLPERRDFACENFEMPQGQQPSNDRAATPSSLTDFGILSPPGELRVTNGAASPDSVRTVRKLHQVQQAELGAHHGQGSAHHKRGSSLQQVMRPEDDTYLEKAEEPHRPVRQLRDEGYFTASDHGASSKDTTPYSDDEKMVAQPGAEHQNISSVKHLDKKQDRSQQTNITCTVDGNRTLSMQTFWLGSLGAEDYKRGITSNPYILSDDSPTLPSQAFPLVEQNKMPSINNGHQRQQSRNPEEALRILNGSHDHLDNTDGRHRAQNVEMTDDLVDAAVDSSIESERESRLPHAENEQQSNEGHRQRESSVRRDSGYIAELPSVSQTQEETKSKYNNPEAPRPVEGGTFGHTMPPSLHGSSSGSSTNPVPLHHGHPTGAMTKHDGKGYEVNVTAAPPVALSKSMSSLKLKPSTWFSRNSSLPYNAHNNNSIQSLATADGSQEGRKAKKLQKIRPKSLSHTVLSKSNEDVSSRPTISDDKDTSKSLANIPKNFSRPPTLDTLPESDATERPKLLAEQDNPNASAAQDHQRRPNRFYENFSVSSKGSHGSQHDENDKGEIASGGPTVGEPKIRRRKSIFSRSKSPSGRSAAHNVPERSSRSKLSLEREVEQEGSVSDGDSADQDFGTVAESLGRSPYDAAMSGKHVQKAAWNSGSRPGNSSFPSHSHQAQQLMGQAMQPVGVPHPHQFSNAHVRRPKSLFSMNEEQASEYARMRSRDRAEMLGKPSPFDPREIPLSSGPARPKSANESLVNKMRPQSMYETYPGAPPVPALPHIATLVNTNATGDKEERSLNKTRMHEKKNAEDMISGCRRPVDDGAHSIDSSLETSRQLARPELENQHMPWNEQKKSIMHEKSRDQSNLPSPIKEEESPAKSWNHTPQSSLGNKLRRKSVGAGRATPNSGRTLETKTGKSGSEDPTSNKSPTEVLEAKLNSTPSQPPNYHASSREEANGNLSMEAGNGHDDYPEPAHLVDSRNTVKNKVPERVTEYQSSNKAIDTVTAPSSVVSISSSARPAYSKLSPHNTSNTPAGQYEERTIPMPRRHIHPSARPRSAHPSSKPHADSRPKPPNRLTSQPYFHPSNGVSKPFGNTLPHSRPRSADSGAAIATSSPAATLVVEHPEVLQRYSGGLRYGWERGSGLGGSAGTRGQGDRASWKGVGDRMSWGIDLGDVPVFVTEK